MIERIALLASLAALTPNANPDATKVYLPAFYESVMAMAPAGKLGEVVKKEEISTSVEGARAWRIAYISSDINGNATISTAIVAAPAGDPPKGGRPVVVWAHGTTGTAENCGPSQQVNPVQPLNEYFLIGGNSATDYGLPAVDRFVRDGYVVVGTDYQGLGGGGTHQYMVTTTQAHDVIDAIRAAGAMPETGAGKRAVIYGWSQGAGAVVTAAGLPDYIAKTGTAFDGIELVGAVAMAPPDVAATVTSMPTDEASAQKMIDQLESSFSGAFNFSHVAMTFWAMPAAFSNLQLTDIFTPEGAQVMNRVMTGKCIHALADTLNYTYGASYKSLLRPQAQNALAWAKALVAGSVPPVKPIAPVIVYYGKDDTTVPPVMGELYQAQMCKIGGNVARVQLEGNQTHYTTPPVAEPLFTAWIEGRFAGKPAENGCSPTIAQ